MRAMSDDYWNTSLPKEHDALRELDAYCHEWGGLTRAEATRRLLIEWAMLRKGKELSAWGATPPARAVASGASEGARRVQAGTQKNHLVSTTAKAASHVLDE